MGKLGFIGLGSQGAPMARRMIEAGYDVVLWARRPESLEAFRDTPAQVAASIAELGAQVEYCGICVVDDAGVQQVCDELLPAMAPGGRIAIHSTIHPDLCKALSEQAASQKLSLVDAPVSGGGQGAAAGTLTVMLGGKTKDVEAIRPILQSFAGLIAHLGDVGTGQSAKLVNNALMAANLAVAHHAFAAADALGINPSAFAEMVKVSSGRSFSFEVRARMPGPTAFNHGAKLLAKDVRLLGDTLGEDPAFVAIRDIAGPFLALALAD
jgi:3-hydroxyisobutyrate dehydrogenase-like beta-hydroxyacid dehydrogenase